MGRSLSDTLNFGGKGRGVERGGDKSKRQETQTSSWGEESGIGVPRVRVFHTTRKSRAICWCERNSLREQAGSVGEEQGR